jgi:hypothetical protein
MLLFVVGAAPALAGYYTLDGTETGVSLTLSIGPEVETSISVSGEIRIEKITIT